ADERADVARHGQRLLRQQILPRAELSGDLLSEEGIAARCLLDPDQGRARECTTERLPQQLMDRGEREGPEADPFHPLLPQWGEEIARSLRVRKAGGQEQPDPLLPEPPRYKLEPTRRRPTHPVH